MRVAVYGTLRKGGRLSYALNDSEFVGEFKITGYKLYDTGLGYPAVVHAKSKEYPLIVEIYNVDKDTMNKLDSIEGYPHFYDREYTEQADAHIYFLYPHQLFDSKYFKPTLIKHGDYMKFLGDVSKLS